MPPAASPGPAAPSVPAPALTDLTDGLRAAWRSAALSVTDTPDLADLLERRLDRLEAQGRLDQRSFSEVLDEVSDTLHAVGLDGVAPQLVRRLLRCVYDFLLAVDARAQAAERGALGVLPAAAAPPPPAGEAAAAPEWLPAALQEVDLLVHRGVLEEAAAALRALADRGAGPALVPVALATGDACRAAGLIRAAADCWQAAWATDRLDERSLWRLAEVALAGGDVELAMSYLHQVVAVLQWRGDARGVARVYRKMFLLTREDAAGPPPPGAPGRPPG